MPLQFFFISLISTCYVNAHTFFPSVLHAIFLKNRIDLCVPLVYATFFSGGLLLLFSLLLSNIVAALWKWEAHTDGNIVKNIWWWYFFKKGWLLGFGIHEQRLLAKSIVRLEPFEIRWPVAAKFRRLHLLGDRICFYLQNQKNYKFLNS